MRTLLAMILLGTTIVLPVALAQDANDTNSTEARPAYAPAPSGHGPCPTDVDCTGGTNPNGGTCMDGQQGNESCDPSVYYLGGPAGSPSNATTQTSDPPQPARVVPALAAAGIVGSAIVATLFASRVRR